VPVLGLPATVSKCEKDPFLYKNYKVMPEGINGDDVTLRTSYGRLQQWNPNRHGSLWIAVWYVAAFMSWSCHYLACNLDVPIGGSEA
jgi:hypothetical protein